jgi:hypothetical protein
MAQTIARVHRTAAAGLLIVGGAGVAAATWVSGNHGWAIGAIAMYAVLAVGAFIWAGRATDIGAILRADGDERQRGLDRDATAIAGIAMSFVAVIGAIIEIGRTGNPGVYGLFCSVGGLVYAGSLIGLRRRR